MVNSPSKKAVIDEGDSNRVINGKVYDPEVQQMKNKVNFFLSQGKKRSLHKEVFNTRKFGFFISKKLNFPESKEPICSTPTRDVLISYKKKTSSRKMSNKDMIHSENILSNNLSKEIHGLKKEIEIKESELICKRILCKQLAEDLRKERDENADFLLREENFLSQQEKNEKKLKDLHDSYHKKLEKKDEALKIEKESIQNLYSQIEKLKKIIKEKNCANEFYEKKYEQIIEGQKILEKNIQEKITEMKVNHINEVSELKSLYEKNEEHLNKILKEERGKFEMNLKKMKNEKKSLQESIELLQEEHEQEMVVLLHGKNKEIEYLDALLKQLKEKIEGLETDYLFLEAKSQNKIEMLEKKMKEEREFVRKEKEKLMKMIEELRKEKKDIHEQLHTTVEEVTLSHKKEREIMKNRSIELRKQLEKTEIELIEEKHKKQEEEEERENEKEIQMNELSNLKTKLEEMEKEKRNVERELSMEQKKTQKLKDEVRELKKIGETNDRMAAQTLEILVEANEKADNSLPHIINKHLRDKESYSWEEITEKANRKVSEIKESVEFDSERMVLKNKKANEEHGVISTLCSKVFEIMIHSLSKQEELNHLNCCYVTKMEEKEQMDKELRFYRKTYNNSFEKRYNLFLSRKM